VDHPSQRHVSAQNRNVLQWQTEHRIPQYIAFNPQTNPTTAHRIPQYIPQRIPQYHATVHSIVPCHSTYHSAMPQYIPQCHSTVHSTVPFHSTSTVPGHSTWNRTGGPKKIILITFLRAGPKTTPTTDHVMTMSSIRRSVGQVPTNSTFWLLFSHYS